MDTLDLVDMNDKVVGKTDKETSHLNGDIHRIVAVFVFAPNEDLYVQEHLKSGGLLDHSVGGHVDRGETYVEAVNREAREELGLSEPLKQVSIFYSDETWGGKNIKHFIGLYECTVPKTWKFSANEEVKHIFPMSLRKIVEMMNSEPKKFTGGFKNTVYEYIKKKNLPFKLKSYNLRKKT